MSYLNEELDLLNTIENDDIKSMQFDNDKIKQIAKEMRLYNQEKNK